MKKKRISRDIPFSEITLRRYEKPGKGSKRELVRKLCLSSGLLQPGDSRDIIVDVLMVMLNSNDPLTSEQVQSSVIKIRKQKKLPLLGIAHSNIRRQLKRLRDLFLIEKIQDGYRITENEELINLFEQKIEKYYINSIIERVREYYRAVK